MVKDTILVLSAHSDDFAIGAGGTIAKYAQEGKNLLVLIFSYGEKSHPWLKRNVVRKFRAEEAVKAAEILRCRLRFLDLTEFKFLEEYHQKKVDAAIQKIIKTKKPSKIFTHSAEDPHPDHRAVHTITLKILETVRYKPEVYMYSIWNPVSFKSHFPTLYVNISSTFRIKLKALRAFPSQRFNAIYPLMILVLKRAIFSGLKIRTTFAENFYRIR